MFLYNIQEYTIYILHIPIFVSNWPIPEQEQPMTSKLLYNPGIEEVSLTEVPQKYPKHYGASVFLFWRSWKQHGFPQ